MNVESDQEIVQLVGTEKEFADAMIPSLHDCRDKKVLTSEQALFWLGARIATEKRFGKPREKVF